MNEHQCQGCGCAVVDGVNGDVSETPWGVVGACCYACDNKAMIDAELVHAEASIEAAARAGRFDCI